MIESLTMCAPVSTSVARARSVGRSRPHSHRACVRRRGRDGEMCSQGGGGGALPADSGRGRARTYEYRPLLVRPDAKDPAERHQREHQRLVEQGHHILLDRVAAYLPGADKLADHPQHDVHGERSDEEQDVAAGVGVEEHVADVVQVGPGEDGHVVDECHEVVERVLLARLDVAHKTPARVGAGVTRRSGPCVAAFLRRGSGSVGRGVAATRRQSTHALDADSPTKRVLVVSCTGRFVHASSFVHASGRWPMLSPKA
eukprot:6447970-Prymnesium_polylepis.1